MSTIGPINPITDTTYISDGYRTGKVQDAVFGNGSPMSPYFAYDFVPAAVCYNNIVTATTPGAAGNLTLAAGTGTTRTTYQGVYPVIALDCPRAISITGTAGNTPVTASVYGWDEYGNPITENIQTPASATTNFGKKAFAFIRTIYVSGGTGGNITVGTSDIFGMPYIARSQNYINPMWNGQFDLDAPKILKGTSAALNTGTVTVNNPNVKSNSIILISANTPGGTMGNLSIGTITPGNSFTILSDNNADTSTVAWEISEPSEYAGTATLVNGTITISSSVVTANSVILVSRNIKGGTLGTLSVGTITAGTSFIINSSSATETSSVFWKIISTNYNSGTSPIYLGQALLVAGTATVTNTYIGSAASGAIVIVEANTLGGTPGFLSAPQGSFTAGTSFVINSSSNADTSIVNYMIINTPVSGTFTVPDMTNPATIISGDVRGTYQPSSPSNGIKRLTFNLFVRGSDIIADKIGTETNDTSLIQSVTNLVGVPQYYDTNH